METLHGTGQALVECDRVQNGFGSLGFERLQDGFDVVVQILRAFQLSVVPDPI